MTFFWRTSRQRNGTKTTQKLRDLNTEIVSSTLPRPDQAFERPQRPTESPTTPTFTPAVPAADVRSDGLGDGAHSTAQLATMSMSMSTPGCAGGTESFLRPPPAPPGPNLRRAFSGGVYVRRVCGHVMAIVDNKMIKEMLFSSPTRSAIQFV